LKVVFYTLALDSMPYIKMQLPIFEESGLDFFWYVSHGAAANTGSTKWCQKQEPRLSKDGTTEFLNSISNHPRVKVFNRQWWSGGKDEMCQIAINNIQQPCLLGQIDSDEIYTAKQLRKIHDIFLEQSIARMYLKCRYFYGKDIYVDPESDRNNSWLRFWRFRPGMVGVVHEPPSLNGNKGSFMSADESARLGLVFDHFSYATKEQLIYKENFYGYKGLVDSWLKLQRHEKFPCMATEFFPFASPTAVLKKL